MRWVQRLAAVGMATAASLSGAVRLWAGEPPAVAPSPSAVPLPTLGGKQFWADELLFHQWRIQRNVYTEHCRLLDSDDLRHAWGSYEHCLAVLEEIKARRKLPPMRGRAVIVLHGLCHSREGMSGLAQYLKEQGGLQVFNVGYPSTRLDIGEHARTLKHILDHLDGIEQIDFVAHSMGNIVIRYYLADQAGKPDRRLRRFVMLGPPNREAYLASLAADNVLFQLIAGAPGQQLGRQWEELQQHLATPRFEFGIIAGGRQGERGYNPLLPGDNDGVVSVSGTRLAGAADFAVLPVLHMVMMNDAKAQEYTLRFLQHGYFISPERKQPIAK
jgi:hypothetical protein